MMQTQPTVRPAVLPAVPPLPSPLPPPLPPPVRRSPGGTAQAGVDVPQPPPDVVRLPPSPHPGPPPATVPPEITEPVVPGQNVPVREPVRPAPPIQSA